MTQKENTKTSSFTLGRREIPEQAKEIVRDAVEEPGVDVVSVEFRMSSNSVPERLAICVAGSDMDLLESDELIERAEVSASKIGYRPRTVVGGRIGDGRNLGDFARTIYIFGERVDGDYSRP